MASTNKVPTSIVLSADDVAYIKEQVQAGYAISRSDFIRGMIRAHKSQNKEMKI